MPLIDVVLLGGIDERLARHRQRLARILLVAGHDHGHVRILQRACGVHRFQGIDHDHVAPLHVIRARAFADGVHALEALVRAFEDRVEVADEQHPWRPGLADVCGDEMASALHVGGHVHPARGEAHRVEGRANHPADLAHAGGVQRATRDVHQPLEIADLLLAPPGHVGAHRRFGLVQG